jgi:hypothetical protein
MAIPRPVAGNPVATYASISALCAAVDDILTALGPVQQSLTTLSAEIQQTGSDLSGQISRSAAAETAARLAQFQTAVDSFTDIRSALNDVQAAANARFDDADATIADLTSRIAVVSGQATTLAAALSAQGLELSAREERPGCAPARFTVVAAASQLAGPRSGLAPVPPAMLAVGDVGPVVRILGAGIVALVQPVPLEDGRLYRFRFAVQRRINPIDPSGDAVVCGVAYLDQSYRLLGHDVVPLQTYPELTKANGRRTCEALVSRTAGLGASFTPPDPGARFAVPVVRTYGPDALTDVEVIGADDVTGQFVLSPAGADFEARMAAMESLLAGQRLDKIESEVGTPSKLTFASEGDAAYATIPANVQVVELLGRSYVGDGGQGLYLRAPGTPPDGADTITSNGAVFQRVVPVADVVAGMLASGFTAWVAGLPTSAPTTSGVAWNNGGAIEVSP